ncbi:hypothetical protein [Aminobacter sp. HY435]|uniref:hypothetical protein n=1 Tax=Aminobacter sp. HY435 TaxID=2970917 RepID=UPI0022B96B2E|nr:hypothetical protein [Aminobacter sp. HY435]
MSTIFDVYAGMLRIATFQTDSGVMRAKRCDAGPRQLEAPQRPCPHGRAKPGWFA